MFFLKLAFRIVTQALVSLDANALTMMDGMGWTSPEAHKLFNLVAQRQAEERRNQRERLSDRVKTLPILQETLDQLCLLSPQDFERVMRAHPAYKAQRDIKSIETMLEVFHRAMSDLNTVIGDFPTLGPPDARIEREALEKEISIRVNKEILAAVSASQALVDYSRRMKDQFDASVFDKKRMEIFDENEHVLVKDLRNLLVHRLHTAANWQTIYSKDGRSTHFKIDTEDLLADAELSAAAKKCLITLGETIDVFELLSRYAERVDQFYGWLLPQVEQHLPEAVRGFRNCRYTVKRHHGRQSYKLMLALWMQGNVDPYAHLPKHLTSEELAAALSLPHQSPVQVDYIISCVDRTSICDEELRKLVYRLFKVTEPNDDRASL